jgi:hypothetical protein
LAYNKNAAGYSPAAFLFFFSIEEIKVIMEILFCQESNTA